MTITATHYRLARRHVDEYVIRTGLQRGQSLGEIVWQEMRRYVDHDDDPILDLPGWPTCECSACGCDEPATTTDDGGTAVCATCADYAIDEDGDVHCARCGDVEEVVECCGAGGQTRSYYRLRPPTMPETDPEGTWCVWWETVGDDSHVVDRYASRVEAEQAVAAHDWPRPGDHTQYLCGYGVRRLDDDGEWTTDDDDDA